MLHRCKNGHECWRELPDHLASFATCQRCSEALFPCPDPSMFIVAPPKGAKFIIGCPKRNCRHPGWWYETNSVQYGEQWLTESWEAWCPSHGGYGQSGLSNIMFDDERGCVAHVSDYTWAIYHGYTDVKLWRRLVLQRRDAA